MVIQASKAYVGQYVWVCNALWVFGGAVYAVFSHFCNVGIFGNLSDPVVPTLSCASGDVLTAYAYYKGCKWGCFDSICLLGYKSTFLAASSLP